MVVLQLSGAVHHVLDLARVAALVDAEEDRCPHEQQGDDCPAGCPTCHCAHVAPALPTVPPPGLAALSFATELAATPPDATGPPRSFRSSVYRPPRDLRST